MHRRTFLALAGSLPTVFRGCAAPQPAPDPAFTMLVPPGVLLSDVVVRRVYSAVGDQYHLLATITDPAVSSIVVDGLTITGIPTTSYREEV